MWLEKKNTHTNIKYSYLNAAAKFAEDALRFGNCNETEEMVSFYVGKIKKRRK